jgi:hypothetical protein
MSAQVLAGPRPATPQHLANAVRGSAVRPGLVVATRFTAYAPQRGSRFLTLFGPTPAQAVTRILQRLDRAPDEVKAETKAMGDIALFGRRPGETRWPLAFVYEGLDEASFNAALGQLAGEAWRPEPGLRS